MPSRRMKKSRAARKPDKRDVPAVVDILGTGEKRKRDVKQSTSPPLDAVVDILGPAEPVIQTHSASVQPNATQLDALLGPQKRSRREEPDRVVSRAPQKPTRNVATAARDAKLHRMRMADRVASATVAARDKFVSDVQIAAKYAHGDAVQMFLSAASTAQALADVGRRPNSLASETVVSAARSIDASLSRVDDLIARHQNNRGERRATELLRTGAGAGVSSILADRDGVRTIDQFVDRVLGLQSIDGLGAELFERPYVVSGLSRRVPNPQYQELARQRQQLETDLAHLRLEQQRMTLGRPARGLQSVAADERRREVVRLQIMQFAPLESVQLLKPNDEVRAINQRWRDLLGSVLVRLNQQYLSATKAAYESNAPDVARGNAEGVAELYVQRVTAPVFNEELARLRSATYEDMPLTREILENYFYRFLGLTLDALLRDRAAAAGDEADLRALREAAIEGARRNVAPGMEAMARDQLFDARTRDAQGRVLSGAEEARRTTVGYLRQALHIYAVPLYERWFASWRAEIEQNEASLTQPAGVDALDTMQRAVAAMVTEREKMERERRRAAGNNALPRFEPPREQEIVDSYARLIQQQVALERTETLLDHDDNNTLERELGRILRSDAQTVDDIDLNVLLHPRRDRFDILDRLVRARRASINSTFQNQAAARTQALNQLATSEAFARQSLIFYSPRQQTVEAHGANDPVDENYSAFDLSYPLDVPTAARQAEALEAAVPPLKRRFDADSIHARADEMRAMLSYNYAERLLRREIMRVEYAAYELTKPEKDVAIDEQRWYHAGAPLRLQAELQLREELKLAARAPDETLSDERIGQAQRALQNAAIRVLWYHRPRYDENGELAGSTQPAVLIKEEQLPINGGPRRSELVRYENGRAVAGEYWAEFRVADDEDEVVYRSRFTALFRVVARCRRDNKVFELGTEVHGECEWREAPRSHQLALAAEEWCVLVTQGPVELAKLRELRAERETRDAVSGAKSDLALPPWGTDDEESLLRAFDNLYGNEAAFRYDTILQRAVSRIGEQGKRALRADLRNNREVWASIAERPWLANSLRKLVGDNNMRAFVESTLLPRDRQGNAEAAERYGAPQEIFTSLPRDQIPPVSPTYSGSVRNIPFATLIAIFTEPVVASALTWREKRFVETLRQRFDSFIERFRVMERRRLYYEMSTHGNVSLPRQSAATGAVTRYAPIHNPEVHGSYYGETPIQSAIEDEITLTIVGLTGDAMRRLISREQFEVRPRAVHNAHQHDALSDYYFDQTNRAAQTGASSLLIDTATQKEFNQLLEERLVRTGLLVVDTRQVADKLTGSLCHHVQLRRARHDDAKLPGLVLTNQSRRLRWIGAHSADTNQPDVYSIAMDAERGAAIVQRGSEPPSKGYDFQGMHSKIEALVTTYSATVRDTTQTAAARQRVLNRIGSDLRTLELVYNFLAFVAPPLGKNGFLPAHTIMTMLKNDKLIDRLRETTLLMC